jgi:3-deoxy-D-manno-octulosonic-acid transferase
MRLLYNILFTISFIPSMPYYFWRLWRRGNWRAGFSQRFGYHAPNFMQAITNRHTLWLHAVSVGEVNICTQLIQALEPRLPNLKIVVSTTTTTGMGILQRALPSHISRIYYPVDFRHCVVRALKTVRPEAIVLVEAEIWPNFLWQASDMRIPLFLVNARLSERSYPRYRRFGFLFRGLFRAFVGIGAQSETDAQRLVELGCRPQAVQVVGSLKFDTANVQSGRGPDVAAMLRQLGVPEYARILVAGSTHPGEEALLAEQFLRLRERFPDLFLVLVPRHFERARKVGRDLKRRGLKFVYRSEVASNTWFEPGQIECLLVNTTGELTAFYERATLIFVGKSLKAKGGQNPIEPGVLGKAMVFGPNMQNFAEVARSFVAAGGAAQVRNASELEQLLGELLDDGERRDYMGRRARAVVQQNLGAIERTVEMIVRQLEGREVYVASASKDAGSPADTARSGQKR